MKHRSEPLGVEQLHRLRHVHELLLRREQAAPDTRFVLVATGGFAPELRAAERAGDVVLVGPDELYGGARGRRARRSGRALRRCSGTRVSSPAAGHRMVSHWWWRPSWSVGKAFYTWHLTFGDGSEMAQLAGRYRDALTKFPGLDVLTSDQLHLTVQGIGFTHDVVESDVSAIVDATRSELAVVATPTVEVDSPHVDAETVQVSVLPVADVAGLRLALRRGIAAVWGEDRVPESMEGFRPHVTLAYSNSTGDRSEVERAVGQAGRSSARFEISTLTLIRLNRDNARYEWDEVVSLPVGERP